MRNFLSRTGGHKVTDIIAQSVSPPHLPGPMLLVTILLLASLAGCGVKSDLVRPNGQPTPQNARDPSQPPAPIGR